MRSLVIGLVLVLMMAGSACADFTCKPNLIFTPDSCMLRITPQDGQLLDGWYLCVTDRRYIGVHHECENIECDEIVIFKPHRSTDMSPYLDSCETALPAGQLSFGALKSYYR
ncbi:MAG: hypothetical protein KOO60_00240 [Gemmatimonadales bacterium]|nr:hypothetical protein [Gemmatimonadales bacterium]